MTIHPRAGEMASKSMLANIPRLVSTYYTHRPDISDPTQQVAFGTSGHRGSSLKNSFNEDHILAISQAICEYRSSQQHHWTAVYGHGYPCLVRTGPGQRP
jgi:phosphoglucomutase